MRPALFSMNIPISEAWPAVQEKPCLRNPWITAAPVLVILVALFRLATCWNSPQPVHMVARPQRTIHLVRAKRAVPASTTGARSEPVLGSDDEPGFDPATLPEAWPYSAGWR